MKQPWIRGANGRVKQICYIVVNGLYHKSKLPGVRAAGPVTDAGRGAGSAGHRAAHRGDPAARSRSGCELRGGQGGDGELGGRVRAALFRQVLDAQARDALPTLAAESVENITLFISKWCIAQTLLWFIHYA